MQRRNNVGLVLIDIQEGLQPCIYYGQDWYPKNAISNCKKALLFFRIYGWPIFHVKHISNDPDSPLFPGKKTQEFRKEIMPEKGEKVYEKRVNSAFIGTDLEADLKKQGIKTLVIVGMTTEHCISTSVRMANNLGFEVILLEDATAAFGKTDHHGNPIPAETVHQVAIANLADEFADIISTERMAILKK